MNRRSILTTGLALGIVLALSLQVFAAPAIEKIQAYVNNQFTFEFDGIEKKLPEDYEVIVYKDRSYVPVRFVVENLGAKVDWDDAKQKITITSKKTDNNTPTDPGSSNGDNKDKAEYKPLPQSKTTEEYKLTAILYGKDSKGDRVYFSLENKQDYPLQLSQADTVIVADGKSYSMDTRQSADFDRRWYSDVRKDEIVEGFILLPQKIKDPEKLHLEITIKKQEPQKVDPIIEVVHFDIAL